MARSFVAKQDAVLAVMVMESSVGSSQLCSVDSSFALNPDDCYPELEQKVMNMLGISELEAHSNGHIC